jgi:hypothetical protein
MIVIRLNIYKFVEPPPHKKLLAMPLTCKLCTCIKSCITIRDNRIISSIQYSERIIFQLQKKFKNVCIKTDKWQKTV